ncbi:MAG: hypothetical protein Q8P02_02820 [Candidatus Micrarchaeota archaeon]|nr:hypothetical protein [Candidatus Micrarchaeota archaeon]
MRKQVREFAKTLKPYPSSRHISFMRPVEIMAIDETIPDVMDELFHGGMKPTLSALLAKRSMADVKFHHLQDATKAADAIAKRKPHAILLSEAAAGAHGAQIMQAARAVGAFVAIRKTGHRRPAWAGKALTFRDFRPPSREKLVAAFMQHYGE